MDGIIPIRLDKALVDGIDSLVTSGKFRNRNEAIRQGIRVLIDTNEMPHHIMHVLVSKIISNILMEKFPNLISGIVLFGSVARGDDTKWSDVDLLVITTREVRLAERLDITREANAILAGLDVIPSLHIEPDREFTDNLRIDMPFERSIIEEGKILSGSLPGA